MCTVTGSPASYTDTFAIWDSCKSAGQRVLQVFHSTRTVCRVCVLEFTTMPAGREMNLPLWLCSPGPWVIIAQMFNVLSRFRKVSDATFNVTSQWNIGTYQWVLEVQASSTLLWFNCGDADTWGHRDHPLCPALGMYMGDWVQFLFPIGKRDW